MTGKFDKAPLPEDSTHNQREDPDRCRDIVSLALRRTKRKLWITFAVFMSVVAGMYFSATFYTELSPYVSIAAVMPIYYCIKILVQSSYRGTGKLPGRWTSAVAGLLAFLLTGLIPLIVFPMLAVGHLSRIETELSPMIEYIETQRTKTGNIPLDIIEAFEIAKPSRDLRCVHYERGHNEFLLWVRNIPETLYHAKPGTVYSSGTGKWHRIFTEAGPGRIPFEVVSRRSYCFSEQKGVWE